MAVDHLLVNEDNDKLIVKDDKLVTVDVPDDCECCDAAVCPTDCSACSSTFTASLTCPTFGAFTVVFTRVASGCVYNPGTPSPNPFGLTITSLQCQLASQNICNTNPAILRWEFCINNSPFDSCGSPSPGNIKFYKAFSGSCPVTGAYISDDGGWTCSLA